MEFHGESYGTYHVTVAHCAKNFRTKNLKKVKKIMSIQEYLKKFQHFLAQLDVFFQINKSKKLYLNTEKTSKNPRNSA